MLDSIDIRAKPSERQKKKKKRNKKNQVSIVSWKKRE